MRYAALKALIFIVLGIIFSRYLSLPNIYLVFYFILAIITAFFTNGYSLYFALFLASALNSNAHISYQKHIENFPLYNVNTTLQAQIIETPIDDNRYGTKLLKINKAPVSGKVFLYIKSPSPLSSPIKGEENIFKLSYGDVIEIKSKISEFDFPRNPNLIDYNNFFRKQGYIGSIFACSSDIKVIETKQGNWLIQHLIVPMRTYFLKTIDKYLDNDEKDLLIGMLLGQKRRMSKSLRDTFADSGVAHILAVSGLHVGILIGVLLLLLPIFRIRGLPQLIFIVILIILYLSITGFKTSAIRASLMVILACLGLFLQRRYEPINGIFIAAIIILLISPQALTDISFQLSFSAATAIILITPRLYDKIKNIKIHKYIKKYLLLPLFVSFSASIGIAPLTLYYFFQFPVLVVFANLLIIPLVGFAVPLGFLVLSLNLVWHNLAGIFANTLWVSLKLTILISERFANISWQIIEPGRPPVLLIILFYLIVSTMLFWKNLRFRKLALTIILVGLNIFIWQKAFQPKGLSITFLDINQGDAIFLELPSTRNMLIDAGEENEIVPQFLKSKGIKKINFAVITHPHLDHYGGYRNLVNEIKIQNILIATDQYKETTYTNLIAMFKSKNINVIYADRGQEIEGLGIKSEIISPDASIKRIYNMNALDPNDLSIVMKLEYNNTSILLPGDLDDTEFIADLPIQAAILKSPHHASKKANSQLLFDRVKPKYMIVTGRKKINQAVMDLIEHNKIKSFNIRKDGAVTIKVQGNKTTYFNYNNIKMLQIANNKYN